MVDSRFLQYWQPREVERQLLAIPRLLRLISMSKLAIGILVLALVTVVIVLPLLHEDDSVIRIALNQEPQAQSTTLPKMLNPRYESTDGDGQPYTIRAEEAVQKDADTVQLSKIQADVALHKGYWLALQAEQGALQVKKKRMYLQGGIHIFSDAGYELRTEEAYVDMASSSALGDLPIQGQGPFGTIRANGFRIVGETQSVFFQDNVKLVLYP